MTDDRAIHHAPWPMRPFLLLGLGVLFGLLVYFLLGLDKNGEATGGPFRLGAAAFLAVAGITFAITLERLRPAWSAAFAAASGFAVGLVVWSNGDPEGWTSNDGWRFAASLLAVAIAVPLFQAARDKGSRRIDPRLALDHAWTDAILWGLSCAFLAAVWILLVLLAGLFGLIGIVSVKEILIEPWFMLMLAGGTLGAIAGLLRDRDNVLGLLHRVARTILSVLAPVLGVGLLLFVAALAFTGLEPLWRETEATTPILLACILAALLLANAVIGNAKEEEPRFRILAWGAMALGAAMLPLAIVAAISMSKRIGQYGLSPDRLWAAIVVAVAVIVSAAYLFALVRGRMNWAPLLRRANVMIVAGIGIVAYLLALPILDFGAVSARDQVARLKAGRIAPEKFDWRAMRFDFGESGLRALERLRDEGLTPDIRARALAALSASDRWATDDRIGAQRREAAGRQIRVLPRPAELPPGLRDSLARSHCRPDSPCFVFYEKGSDHAVAVAGPQCPNPEAPDEVLRGDDCETAVSTFRLEDGKWGADFPAMTSAGQLAAWAQADLEAMSRNQVEIRAVERHQVFVGGRPVGNTID
ncbi:MAG TPA: DUF4153 domain-containing protein [Allosphingosinicella sp.]|nr:DUF4153 domain-containing protein [Allosphingosinicella sp.]